ncbi:hypothetical protein E2C01_004997 [Portunus trituberculatus]|uniref:Uncharacterized protein n=1 Tax=Portunus trituberculatus TaxID=210409 RepID=A0A5B7CTU9_PORTR|nr:hypothetical protein [Portunus trituberculatus]
MASRAAVLYEEQPLLPRARQPSRSSALSPPPPPPATASNRRRRGARGCGEGAPRGGDPLVASQGEWGAGNTTSLGVSMLGWLGGGGGGSAANKAMVVSSSKRSNLNPGGKKVTNLLTKLTQRPFSPGGVGP